MKPKVLYHLSIYKCFFMCKFYLWSMVELMIQASTFFILLKLKPKINATNFWYTSPFSMKVVNLLLLMSTKPYINIHLLSPNAN